MYNDLIVILPVINEKINLKKLIPSLLKYLDDAGSILIIDDNSNDGTDKYILKLKETCKNIFYIKNKYKTGLGNAYKQGFSFAIKNDFKWVQQMDSDLSHRVKDLKNFDKKVNISDLIIGSRYVKGGGVVDWPLRRRLLSKFGSIYARVILGVKINDFTGGFNRIKVELLKKINILNIKSNGYSFQIELKYKSAQKKAKINEVPIIFADRVVGETKMSFNIIVEAVFQVIKLKLFR